MKSISILFLIYSIQAINTEEILNATIPSRGFGVKRSPSANLFYSKECQDDIRRFCPNPGNVEMSDMTVLQCIHNQVSDLSQIDKECHNLLYSLKRNLTLRLNFDNSALKVCKNDLTKLTECQSVDKEDNGHLVSCLLDSKENITDPGCKAFLTNVAALVFSDFRLIYNFVSDCQADIDKLSCGRLEKEIDDNPTQQGATIACLARKYDKLDLKCKAQIVRVTELQSDDFHLDRSLYFACREDREKLCQRVQSGDGRVYDCLIRNKFNQLMSKECLGQLTQRQRVIAENPRADKKLVIACKKDILSHKCRKELRANGTDDFKLAGLILCLEAATKEGLELESECEAQLIDHRKSLMSDYQLSPNIVKFCSKEITDFCGGGVKRDGKTLHCLLKVSKSSVKNTKIEFSSQCTQELKNLIKVVDPSQDIRVDPDLQEACQSILNDQCKNVRPGKGRVIQCLLSYLNKPVMTDDCEERLLEIQFFVARDWKLTPSLYKACKEDARSVCSAKTTWDDESTDVDNGPLVLPCLYHHIHDQDDSGEDKSKKISKECAKEVKKAMETRASSIDLMPEIQDNCSNDLAKYCSSLDLNVKGEELRCLQKNIKTLEENCEKAIAKYTSEESEDISLDKILMKSCVPTIEEFCSDKKEEKGELLECLIKQKNNGKIQEKCRIGIEHHQLLSLENVDFNFKFKRSCKDEIGEHCRDIIKKNEVIQCLSEIILNDTLLEDSHRISGMCRSQLRFELFQLNEDIKLDSDLEAVCSDDVKSLCGRVKSGKGQVLECLRTNSKALSEGCKERLFKRDKINLVEQSADFGLQTKCKNSIQQYCHVDGEEDVISCLRKYLLKSGFEQSCREVLINRIMMQNKDARLNPTLWKSCSKEASNKCKSAFVDIQDTNESLNGRVLRCLKVMYTKNELSQQCESEVEQVMREAANIDYRLDPLLAEGCISELEEHCFDASNDKKEDCLRLSLQKGKIARGTQCFEVNIKLCI